MGSGVPTGVPVGGWVGVSVAVAVLVGDADRVPTAGSSSPATSVASAPDSGSGVSAAGVADELSAAPLCPPVPSLNVIAAAPAPTMTAVIISNHIGALWALTPRIVPNSL